MNTGISNTGLKHRIVRETVKDILYDVLSSDYKNIEYTRYVCQECVEYLEVLPGAIFPTKGGTDWKTMKWIGIDFAEREAIFTNEQTARDFLDGKFGKINEEVVYEK